MVTLYFPRGTHSLYLSAYLIFLALIFDSILFIRAWFCMHRHVVKLIYKIHIWSQSIGYYQNRTIDLIFVFFILVFPLIATENKNLSQWYQSYSSPNYVRVLRFCCMLACACACVFMSGDLEISTRLFRVCFKI